MLFGSLPAPALAQPAEPRPAIETSTSTPTAPGPPYGREDVPFLETRLAEARQAFDAALARWTQVVAAEPGSSAHARAGEVLEVAEKRVTELEAELTLARTAPPRRLVEARAAYDRDVARIAEAHRRLLVLSGRSETPASSAAQGRRSVTSAGSRREEPRVVEPAPRLAAEGTPTEDGELRLGERALAVYEAEQELAGLAEARRTVLETPRRPSPVYERLSDLEKIDEQLRNEEEKLAFAERIHQHLEQVVFAQYVAYEEEVEAALQAFARLEALWPSLRGTEAVRYREPALSPQQVARRWILAGPTEAEPGIRALWAARGGEREKTPLLSVRAHADRLAGFRREMEEHRFVRDRLVADAERLRTLEAQKARPSSNDAEPTNIPAAAPPGSEYARLSTRIDEAEVRLEVLGNERGKLEVEILEVEGELKERRVEETSAKDEMLEAEKQLMEREATKDLRFPGRGGERPRQIQNFVLAEQLASDRRRLEAVDRAIRRTEIRRDVLRRRLQAIDSERLRIQELDLPRLRKAYYLALLETFGIRGLRIFVVLALAVGLVRLIRKGSAPVIEGILRNTLDLQGAEAIRRQRARTLMSVSAGAARFFIYILAFFFVIGQLDIDYGPLLVAAGGLSLAVGFGAQSLVKDFVSGFFILLEGQYSIGDVVDIDGRAGIVEDLNLRTTVLRSLNGEVHTIPNGEITTTTNKTKFWSRAVVDVGVAYEENIDEVTSVLQRVGSGMLDHELWRAKLRSVEVLGLEALSDSSIVIRVLLETEPGEQWAITREFQRRVKLTFDELGIEIPWPQRVITHKAGVPDEARLSQKRRAIRRFVGKSSEAPTSPTSVSVEGRDRAEAIAQKEAAILEKEEERSEAGGAEEPPTLLEMRDAPSRPPPVRPRSTSGARRPPEGDGDAPDEER